MAIWKTLFLFAEPYVAHSSANFTALAGAFQSVSSTAEGTALLAKLPAPPGFGRKSLLAPTNEVSGLGLLVLERPNHHVGEQAFAAVTEDVSGNATLMANILSYVAPIT
jgi:hypothetical protein